MGQLAAGRLMSGSPLITAVSGGAAGVPVGAAALDGLFPAAKSGLMRRLLAIGTTKKQAGWFIEGCAYLMEIGIAPHFHFAAPQRNRDKKGLQYNFSVAGGPIPERTQQGPFAPTSRFDAHPSMASGLLNDAASLRRDGPTS